MNKVWQAEKIEILTTLAIILVLGVMFENWLIATLIPLVSYIVWMYMRLEKLEKWLSRGTKPSEVYDDNGYLDLIIRHLFLQRKNNNKRKKRTKELLRRLNTNISALPDATVLLNQHYEIEWSNEPATYLLGLTRADIGQRIDNLIRHPKFHKYLNNPEKQKYLELESPLAKQEILQLKVVLFGSNQRLMIVRNISEQKHLQTALKNFVANASHELQTPLTTIIGHLEMLDMHQGMDSTAKHSINAAQRQSLRMKYMIQDLLMLSKLESYRLNMDEGKPMIIKELMSNVFQSLGKTCEKNHIKCHVPEKFQLLGEQKEIEGLCINLIENAIKHNPEKTEISISWKENKNKELVFEVTDKGQGILERDLPFITDRYYRGKNSSEREITGSGLGLAIVQQAAYKHGAELEIKSEQGKGSTFQVIFPSYRVI